MTSRPQRNEVTMESLPKGNEDLVRELWGVFAGRHEKPSAEVGRFLSASYVHRFDTQAVFSREQYLQAVDVFYSAFPDLHYVIEELIATDDQVVVRYEATGTHRAEFFGFPATGRAVRYGGVFWYRIEGNLIAEDYEFWDGKGFHAQLGLKIPGLD